MNLFPVDMEQNAPFQIKCEEVIGSPSGSNGSLTPQGGRGRGKKGSSTPRTPSTPRSRERRKAAAQAEKMNASRAELDSVSEEEPDDIFADVDHDPNLEEDSDYDPEEEDEPVQKKKRTPRRSKGGGGRTPAKRTPRGRKSMDAKDSDEGSTDLDEGGDEFAIEEGYDDAGEGDLFDSQQNKNDVYDFDAQSIVSIQKKSTKVVKRPASAARKSTNVSNWGANIYSALATSLKTRADLETYTNFLKCPRINADMDRVLVDMCKPSGQHMSLFFGPSASLQALMSRIPDNDLVLDLLHTVMKMPFGELSHKANLFVPMVHQPVAPLSRYTLLSDRLNSVASGLGYDSVISPGYLLNPSTNVLLWSSREKICTPHQLAQFLMTMPTGKFFDLCDQVVVQPAIFEALKNSITASPEDVLAYAEDPSVELPQESLNMTRVTLSIDSQGRLLAFSVLDTIETHKVAHSRRRHPYTFFDDRKEDARTKQVFDRQGKDVRAEVEELLNGMVDWIGSQSSGGGQGPHLRFSSTPEQEQLAGVHTLDAFLMMPNSMPNVLLLVGVRQTACPSLRPDSDVPQLLVFSLIDDENMFMKPHGLRSSTPIMPVDKHVMDASMLVDTRSLLLVPDALYEKMRRAGLIELHTSSGAGFISAVSALHVGQDSLRSKFVILDSVAHTPLCVAYEMPITLSMQLQADEAVVRKAGRVSNDELATFTSQDMALAQERFKNVTSEYKCVVINGVLCAIKIDPASKVVEKLIELAPASYADVYPSRQRFLYGAQALGSEPKSVTAFMRIYNRETDSATFLPAIYYRQADLSLLSNTVAGFADCMLDVMHRMPVRLSFYALVLRMALKSTPKILARQHRTSALTNRTDGEVPPIPEAWSMCVLCLKELSSTTGLFAHEIRHCNLGRYACREHNVTCASETAFAKHLAQMHGGSAPSGLAEQEEGDGDDMASGLSSVFAASRSGTKLLCPQCDQCGDYFPTADAIAQHMETCDRTSFMLRTPLPKASLAADGEEEGETGGHLVCGVCGMQLRSMDSMNEHFLEYHLKCVVCGESQRSMEQLSYHYGQHLEKADPQLLMMPPPSMPASQEAGASQPAEGEEPEAVRCLRSIMTCDICPTYHATANNYYFHQLTEHGIMHPPLQNEGGASAVNQLTTFHGSNATVVTAKYMACKFCNAEVRVSGNDYVKHLQEEHQHSTDMYCICRICGEVCDTRELLSDHLASRHATGVYVNAGVQTVYSCPHCVFYAFNRSMLEHCKKTHGDSKPAIFECSHCTQRFSDRAEYRRHLSSHTEGYMFQCRECDRSFRLRHSLLLHMINHHPDEDDKGSQTCEFCGVVFPKPSLLRHHVNRKHNKELVFECLECHRRFRYETELRRHTKTMHSGAVKCEVCNKMCPNMRSYTSHRQKHFKMRVYQCTDCNATFKSRTSMKRHIRVEHLKLGPELFECQICGKVVTQIGMHMLTHKGARFECEYCGKGFTKSAYYTEHLRIHRGVMPHECHICKKRFTKKSNMNVHVRFHEKHKDADGNYLELKPRGRISTMFGDANLTPEQRLARQNVRNIIIPPTEHVMVGPDLPGAFNVGGAQMAAADACAQALEASGGGIRLMGNERILTAKRMVVVEKFDEVMANSSAMNGTDQGSELKRPRFSDSAENGSAQL